MLSHPNPAIIHDEFVEQTQRMYNFTVDIAHTYFVGEIMEAGSPVVDPRGWLENGLRWDVTGTFNGSTGIWELVVDIDTNTVVHFLFKGR